MPAKKTVKKKHPLKRCDDLFHGIIRARGRCEACGKPFDLQCAHGFSRRYRATRWDERNAFCLCRGCHFFFTVRPLEWDEWMRETMGEGLYDDVRREALRTDFKVEWTPLLERLNRRSKELV